MTPKAHTKDHPLPLPPDRPIPARACQMGDRLQLRGMTETPLAAEPLFLPVNQHGFAALFRYGAVVTFNLTREEHLSYLEHLTSRVIEPLPSPETEETSIFLTATPLEGVTMEGIGLHPLSIPRLQVVAIVLARSVVLARYEVATTGAFDAVEPLLSLMEQAWEKRERVRDLLRLITGALGVQHRMAGRVEIQDKPDLLWDHPELERLYLRLEKEYELRERNAVLERKLALLSSTMETTITLLNNRRSQRLEWYIIILIVIEVVLYSYDMWGLR
ncbi:MAG: RMD1 family protein [Nitrospirae bacterium]|nr:RMD1 family protein [Nitrospirota bacterium]